MDGLRAANFLARYVLTSKAYGGAALGIPHRLTLRDGTVDDAHLYVPASRPWATVVAVHGMTLRAHRDPRLVGLCRALQAVGVCVVAPRVPALAALEVSAQTPDAIADRLCAVLDDPALPARGRVGVLTASFAAGLTLVAAARPDLAERLGGLLLIGTYVDAWSLLRFSLAMPSGDPYARMILVRSLLRTELSPAVIGALDVGLADISWRRAQPELPAVLASLPPADRARYARLVAPDDAERLFDQIRAARADDISRIDPCAVLPSVRASLSLLHGRTDPVIPPSESERLVALAHSPVRLHVTDLLGHGDITPSPRHLGEVPAVIGLFAHFFETLRV